MAEKVIPDIVVARLPIYLRTLQQLKAEGRKITLSQELGEMLGISAAQIRKDLSLFGEFGKQGTGYNINYLIDRLCEILNVGKEWEVAVIGAGDIGSALVSHQGFANRGFRVNMIFDKNPEKIGTKLGGFFVKNSDELVETIRSSEIKIAMLTVPAENAQEVAEKLVEAGVKAILNYAPIYLKLPSDIRVQYIDPSVHLQHMTYYL